MILTKGQKEYSKYVPVRKAENIFSFTNAANSGETTQVDCIRNKNKLFFFFFPQTHIIISRVTVVGIWKKNKKGY